MKRLPVIVLSCWLAALPAAAYTAEYPAEYPADPPAGGVLTLEAAVTTATIGNHGLSERRAAARAAAHVPERVGALPDPTLKAGVMNLPVDSYSLSDQPMTQLQVGITQMVPFPGKRGLMASAAEHDAKAAEARAAEAQLALAAEVSVVWWHLFHLDRAISIVGSNQELLRQFVNVARTKYRVGKGLQQDVLLAEVELSQLLDRELVLKGEREAAAARLNALLGRTPDAPVILPEEMDVALFEAPTLATLTERIERHRPVVVAARHRLEAAGERVALAGKAFWPDFSLSAAYGFRQDDPAGVDRPDFATFMVGIQVPLQRGAKRAAVAERREMDEAARRAYEELRVRAAAEAARHRADYERARRHVELLSEGIIPQASQMVASMLTGYQVNKVDFLNLVRAQITLYDHEIRYWRGVSDAMGARARLAAAVGQPVEDGRFDLVPENVAETGPESEQ